MILTQAFEPEGVSREPEVVEVFGIVRTSRMQ